LPSRGAVAAYLRRAGRRRGGLYSEARWLGARVLNSDQELRQRQPASADTRGTGRRTMTSGRAAIESSLRQLGDPRALTELDLRTVALREGVTVESVREVSR